MGATWSSMDHGPVEVLDQISELGWQGVLGNTDEILWTPDRLTELTGRFPTRADLIRVMFEEFAPRVREMLGDERVEWLRTLPTEWSTEDFLLLVHASPGDLWSAPRADDNDEVLRKTFGGLEAGLAVYGHIHRPFVRELEGGLTVANSGSVGLPWDGDWRGSYLLIEDGRPSVRRVEYDLDRELTDLGASSLPYTDWLGQMRRIGTYFPPPVER